MAAIDTINANSKLLADMDYSKTKTGKENRKMLKRVLEYYANPFGISKVGSGYKNGETSILYYDRSDKTITAKIRKDGKISDKLNDINNLKNALIHEKEHRDHEDTRLPLYHPLAIIAQMNSPTWGNTTPEFKKSVMKYAEKLFQEAANEKKDGSYVYTNDEIQKQIDEYNSVAAKLGLSTGLFMIRKKERLVRLH